MSASRTIEFANGIAMDLAMSSGNRFLGIGEVRLDGRPLRSGRAPWTFHFECDEGVQFDCMQLEGVDANESGAVLRLSARGRWMPRAQEMDAMGDSRIRARRVATPEATARWTFRAVEEALYENAWRGLAMSIEIDSPGLRTNWILEEATWEIGGEARGCTLIQQDVSAMDLEQRVEADSDLTTAECFAIKEDGEWTRAYPMDMMPRGAGAAVVDFQVKGDTALCLFSEKPGLTRARLEKRADEDVIHYLDRPLFPSTDSPRPPARKLLVYRHDQELKAHEWRNLWLDCFMESRRRIHANYDFSLRVPTPMVSGHLWDPQFVQYGDTWQQPLIDMFPVYERLGYKTIYTHGVWEGPTGDESTSGNICTPYAYRHKDQFGGPAGMRRLVDAAHAAGIAVYHWVGMQFHKAAEIWKDHPDWILGKANGEPWDAGYEILQCGRMRSGYRDHLYNQLKQVREETGLDGIFWDSYQNLGATCIDWTADDQAPQFEEIIALQSDLQKLGLGHNCEIVTIFGVSQVGMLSFADDSFVRRFWEPVVASDAAFALLDTSPAFHTSGETFGPERLDDKAYFWLLAHRAVPGVDIYPWGHGATASQPDPSWPGGENAEAYGRVNRLYNEALPRMVRLRLVAGGGHVLWLNEVGEPAVIWAFVDEEIDFTGSARDLEDGAIETAEGTLNATAGHVYFLD